MMLRRRTLSVFGVGGRPMARPLTRLLTGAGLSLAALMASCSTPASEQAVAVTPVAVDAYVAHRDPDSGAPTFVWLDGKPAQAQAGDAREIGDREAAIRTAFAGLASGDTLLVAGKGHETYQIVGDQVLPFDDAAILRAAAQDAGGKVP